MIGLVVDYKRCDESFAMIQLARWLDSTDYAVNVIPIGWSPPLCDYWDVRASRNRNESLESLTDECSHVVFCRTPSNDTLKKLKKKKHLKIILISLWDHLPANGECYPDGIDIVVCSSPSLARHIRQKGLFSGRVVGLAWDLMMSPVKSDQEVDDNRIGIVWNLDGSQSKQQDLSIVDLLRPLVDMPNIYFAVFYNDSVSLPTRGGLEDLRCRASGRMEVFRNPSLEEQVLISSVHDLSIWPVLQEGFGLPGLITTIAGTPCLAYSHPVVAEIISHNHSGILVPCQTHNNRSGSPVSTPDTREFCRQLTDLVNKPQTLQRLRDHMQKYPDDQQKRFRDIMSDLFSQ